MSFSGLPHADLRLTRSCRRRTSTVIVSASSTTWRLVRTLPWRSTMTPVGSVLEVGLDKHERRTDGVVDDLRSGRRRGHRRECVLDAGLDLVGRQLIGRRDDAVERDGEEGRGHARDEEPPPPIPRSEAVQWSARSVAHRVDVAVGLVHLVGRCWEVRHVRPFGADVNGTGDGSKGLLGASSADLVEVQGRPSGGCAASAPRGGCTARCGVRRGAAGAPSVPRELFFNKQADGTGGAGRTYLQHPADRGVDATSDPSKVPKLAPFGSRMRPDLKRSGPVSPPGTTMRRGSALPADSQRTRHPVHRRCLCRP